MGIRRTMPTSNICLYCHITIRMMNSFLGRKLVATIFGRPSGALSDLWRSDRGLSPPAYGGRPSGANKRPSDSFTHTPAAWNAVNGEDA